MEFVIDCSRWQRGVEGKLLDAASGQMCIMGFMCREFGYGDHDLQGRSSASCVVHRTSKVLKGIELLVFQDEDGPDETEFAEEIAQINDDEDTTDRQKKGRLKKVFEENGHTIEFVG